MPSSLLTVNHITDTGAGIKKSLRATWRADHAPHLAPRRRRAVRVARKRRQSRPTAAAMAAWAAAAAATGAVWALLRRERSTVDKAIERAKEDAADCAAQDLALQSYVESEQPGSRAAASLPPSCRADAAARLRTRDLCLCLPPSARGRCDALPPAGTMRVARASTAKTRTTSCWDRAEHSRQRCAAASRPSRRYAAPRRGLRAATRAAVSWRAIVCELSAGNGWDTAFLLACAAMPAGREGSGCSGVF